MLITLLIAILTTGVFEVDAADKRREKDKHIFVVKTERKFAGAKVEVFNASGQLLTVHTLKDRRMVIDFADVKLGAYTIRVSKDEETKEFYYEKK